MAELAQDPHTPLDLKMRLNAEVALYTMPRLRPVDVPAVLSLVQAIYRLNGLPPLTPEELRGGPLDMKHALLELIGGRCGEEATEGQETQTVCD